MHKYISIYVLSRRSLLSSLHDSNVYGISAPLQSKNDTVKMAPFKRNIVAPTKDTTTGWDDLLSGSGGLISIVSTDPRLVPTHKVGVRTVGSAKNFYKAALNR